MPKIPLINIKKLSVGFKSKSGEMLPVLRSINLKLHAGESLGLVGESGSGKSTLALAAMGYLKSGLSLMEGNVSFEYHDMFNLDHKRLQKIWGRELALVPQNSGQSLTPTMRVGQQLREVLEFHNLKKDKAIHQRIIQLLTQVRLPEPETLLTRFPHELSGGQQQRVAIAIALAGEPKVLLLDEPTTGLDVTTQAHILELLREIANKTQMALLYVSHDLGAIARVCDEVLVMYAGQAVLSGSAKTVLRSPSHPYAHGLLASIPKLNDPSLPDALEGRPPAPGQASAGCAFADRCFIAENICRTEHPPVKKLSDSQKTRCHFPDLVKKITSNKASEKKKFNFKNDSPTISMNELSIRYKNKGFVDQLLRRPHKGPATVDCINLSISKGETLGLVGESGSGKSTILKSIAGLLQPSGGKISLENNSYLPTAVEYRSSDQLRRVQLVFQNPDDSLNPRHTVRQILEQPLKLYFTLTKKQIYEKSVQILEQVRLGSHYLDRLPSQLSGGEKQRIAIARAFVAEPDIVLCDEVTSALDVSVQAAVLELLNELKQTQRTTYVFVSHDLAVVKALSDRVAVLYQGRLCEIGPTSQVYNRPSHPYTEVLLGAVLEPDPDHELKLMADDIVELAPPENGCPFQRRCPRIVGDICKSEAPPWQTLPTGNLICCHIPWEALDKMQTD
tara:strand:- start:875 stop:2902 length:2028 start_codon:yes stop_codon:yes gene_type:complete